MIELDSGPLTTVDTKKHETKQIFRGTKNTEAETMNGDQMTDEGVQAGNGEVKEVMHISDQKKQRMEARDANTPLTPTSFKLNRSDTSDSVSDTSPSSIEEHMNNNSGARFSESSAKRIITSIDPLQVPEVTSSESTIKSPENRGQNNIPFITSRHEEGTGSSSGARRHKSLQNVERLRSQDELTGETRYRPTAPITRQTFPLYNHSGQDMIAVRRSSTSSEIHRMRNSIMVKRSLKKKRMNTEDDRVLVGNKISEGHENFVMAYNMLTGIRVAVSRCSGVMKKLKEEDFKSSKKLTFNMDGSELTPSSKYDFKFKDYCPEVFRELRSLFGLDPAEYLVSITGKYILSELGSPGKSGSFFYYSRDYRYIIKTIHHSEHKQLRKILKEYYNHVKENPNTLVSQFYGLHRLKMPFSKNGVRKVHFIVMNNLFPPHRDIHLKYDLKGSTYGRKTVVHKESEVSALTLKDLNWLERGDKIKFGPDKQKLFVDQLESDVKLMKRINVMDYSLLLGIHDVKKGNNEERTTKLSVFDPKSTNKYELITTNPRDIDRANDLPSNVFPGRSKYVFYGHDGGIRATSNTNEPITEIYYLGIIDCLTNYSLKKKLETFWRSLSHTRSTISAVPANEYGDRFLNFIKEGTKMVRSSSSEH